MQEDYLEEAGKILKETESDTNFGGKFYSKYVINSLLSLKVHILCQCRMP